MINNSFEYFMNMIIFKELIESEDRQDKFLKSIMQLKGMTNEDEKGMPYGFKGKTS